MYWFDKGKLHTFQLSTLSADEYAADETLRKHDKKAWEEENKEILYEDMRKRGIKLPLPIIPCGDGWYIVRPETTDDVKNVRKIYSGKVFRRIRNPFGRGYGFDDVCGMSYDVEYVKCQDALERIKHRVVWDEIEVSEMMARLVNKWTNRMAWAMGGYEESWVKNLAQELTWYFASSYPRPTEYAPSDRICDKKDL